jgi:hypothetical protein
MLNHIANNIMNNIITVDHVRALGELLRTKSDEELSLMYKCLMRDYSHHIGVDDVETATNMYADAFPGESVPDIRVVGGASVKPYRPAKPYRPLRPTLPSKNSRPAKPSKRPPSRDKSTTYIAPAALLVIILAVITTVGLVYRNDHIRQKVQGLADNLDDVVKPIIAQINKPDTDSDLYKFAKDAEPPWPETDTIETFRASLDLLEAVAMQAIINLRVGAFDEIFYVKQHPGDRRANVRSEIIRALKNLQTATCARAAYSNDKSIMETLAQNIQRVELVSFKWLTNNTFESSKLDADNAEQSIEHINAVIKARDPPIQRKAGPEYLELMRPHFGAAGRQITAFADANKSIIDSIANINPLISAANAKVHFLSANANTPVLSAKTASDILGSLTRLHNNQYVAELDPRYKASLLDAPYGGTAQKYTLIRFGLSRYFARVLTDQTSYV